MMKSSMPRTGGSTRDERWAGGGPCCSAWLTAAASKLMVWGLQWGLRDRLSDGGRLVLGMDHVLDGLVGGAPHALYQVGPQPAGFGLGEGGYNDIVDAEVLERVRDRGVGIWVAYEPRGQDARVVQPVEQQL